MISQASSPGVAVSGVVRADQLDIVLRHADTAPRTVHFDFCVASGAVRVTRAWPEDFEITEVEGEPHGRIRLPWALAEGPFGAVDVLGDEDRAYERGDAYDLHALCAFTAEEGLAYYFTKPTRPQDAETQFFVGRQNRDHYFADGGHRKFISVFFGYRALDMGGADRLQEAVDWIEAERGSDYWVITDHLRTDSLHQSMSSLMALWHLDLALGRYDSVVSRLDEAIAIMRGITDFQAYYAYNGCRMMLLKAYLLLLEGRQDEASELCEFNLHFYKHCCMQAIMRPILFKEMREPHHAVYLGLELHQGVLLKRRLMAGEPIFKAVNRVKTEPALTLQTERFDGLLQAARDRGFARRRAARKAARAQVAAA